jgi:hypothetical protein
MLLSIQVYIRFARLIPVIFTIFTISNVECVELLLDRGAQPTVEMLHAAFDEARLACLLSRGCVPDDIPVFLHHCIRSKGFVRPDLDSKRFAPLTRQSQGPSQAAPHDDPINSAKQKAMSHAPHARKRKEYVGPILWLPRIQKKIGQRLTWFFSAIILISKIGSSVQGTLTVPMPTA